MYRITYVVNKDTMNILRTEEMLHLRCLQCRGGGGGGGAKIADFTSPAFEALILIGNDILTFREI